MFDMILNMSVLLLSTWKALTTELQLISKIAPGSSYFLFRLSYRCLWIKCFIHFWLFKLQPHKMVKHTQTIRRQQPTNCLSVFDHFVGLALKRLKKIKILFSILTKWIHGRFGKSLNSVLEAIISLKEGM